MSIKLILIDVLQILRKCLFDYCSKKKKAKCYCACRLYIVTKDPNWTKLIKICITRSNNQNIEVLKAGLIWCSILCSKTVRWILRPWPNFCSFFFGSSVQPLVLMLGPRRSVSSLMFWSQVVCRPSVRNLFTFSTSPAQRYLRQRGFKFVKNKDSVLFYGEVIRNCWNILRNFLRKKN